MTTDLLAFVRRLATDGGAIVSSAACCPMEIACARAGGRFWVDPETACGYVIRPKAWLDIARAGVDLAVAYSEQKPMAAMTNEEHEAQLSRVSAAEIRWNEVYPACVDKRQS